MLRPAKLWPRRKRQFLPALQVKNTLSPAVDSFGILRYDLIVSILGQVVVT